MKKILVNFAHPARSRSVMNSALRTAAEGIEGVTVNDLYANYPDFMIDIEREQRLCEEHDIIIFQHPFYWYSTPSIVKEWFDLVLQHGWAYGSTGNSLSGKILFQTLTAGGDASTYKCDGLNLFTVAELTSPIRATANLCKMTWLPPFAVMGIHRGLPVDQKEKHAYDYQNTLIALRDSKFDIGKGVQMDTLNDDLSQLIAGV